MNVFLDTMVYLHCVPIDQIDLCATLQTDSVTLLVPRVTFKELEKHKASHATSRVRDRSRQALSFLEKQIESGSPIREGVAIRFIPNMPKIDLLSYGLNPEWNDDLLIGSVLECKEQQPTVEAVLVTHDTGARLTCRHLGIRTFELPGIYHLQPELDDTEKETQRLRRELQKLQNALPRLKIGIADANDPSAIRADDIDPVATFEIESPEEICESRITAALAEAAESLADNRDKSTPVIEQNLLTQLGSMSALDPIPPEEHARFRAERERYYKELDRYLRELVKAKNLAKRTILFSIAVANIGSAPADDVDIHLHFPDGFDICLEEDLPELPREPRRPLRPRTQLEVFRSQISIPNLMSHVGQMPDFTMPPSIKIRKTNSYDIADHFKRVKHGDVEQLAPLYLIFDSFEKASSFHCDYEIRVGNLPDKINGKLHFVIEKPTSI